MIQAASPRPIFLLLDTETPDEFFSWEAYGICTRDGSATNCSVTTTPMPPCGILAGYKYFESISLFGEIYAYNLNNSSRNCQTIYPSRMFLAMLQIEFP